MRRSALLLFFLTISHLLLAQQGTLTGKVTDKKTGEGAIGATVLVTGTTQAAPVDLDGSYSLKLAPGTYGITIQSIGYKPLTFTGISIQADQQTTLNGVLEENAQALKEVVVTGQKQTGTEVAMIQDLKKAEVVVSGMSNDQIVKSLDRDAAEVVKRIPGVTIQNNNFIVIRGLAERYNTVLLNEALTPSAEVDTRSFSFDILPSSVIDRVLIFKSGAPELPGEFGGGVVEVFTRNSVLENSTNINITGGYRSGTTFTNNYQTTNHSSTDWLGFDSGDRALPNALPGFGNGNDLNNLPDDRLKQVGNQLRNEWKPSLITARPDLRLSLGLTRKFELGKLYLSNVTSVSYTNTLQQYDTRRSRYQSYDTLRQSASLLTDYNDQRTLSTARLGVIHNWQARFNDYNRLDFRNFLNQYGTDEVVHRTGPSYEQGGPGQGQDFDNYSLHYQSRTIYSGQLQGTHETGANKRNTFVWAGGYNYVFRDEPDYRRFRTQRSQETDPATTPFEVVVPLTGSQLDASHYFSKLTENTYMGRGQWERRIQGRDTTQANEYKLRAGFYTEYKSRDYDSRYFSFVRTPDTDPRLRKLPIETIFNPENINNQDGFRLDEGTQANDRYSANNLLAAGYLSTVLPISDKFNVSGGVRVEYNRRQLESGDIAVAPYEEKRTFVLPSFNAAYNFNLRSLVRLASSISVNRPEFRELAQYQYYDFANSYFLEGNPNLRTAKIYNADLRYEFYPTRSEMLSIGVFYKHFQNAIEQTTTSTGGLNLYLTYQNAKSAYDMGVEVEARKSLAELTGSGFIDRLSLVMNASLIRSRVQLEDNERNRNFAITDRPLQGQSPYVVNLGLFYQDNDHGWQASAQYNVIGPRIMFVGDRGTNFSVIELPRHVVDLSVTKSVGKHLQVKAGIQDAFNQLVRQYYDFNGNNKIDSFETGAFARYKRGQYSSLGLTWNF
ncbi:TonB-dependent receptor [Hymenobacter sediminis]|uniref:TonB-dependent receptor n=1 Tax=Hymenobacter sediminis TaxID=2218621 RepID=UPI000DA652A7|nr:TonB-dependent receptor [Hymenobacter sediminis]RPD49755.1 TonB-dependent receptor [Hymenobacter sediminis]